MAWVVWYGTYLAKNDGLSVGAVSAFLLYMVQVIFIFVVMGFAVANLYKVAGAAEKVMEMMKYIPEVNSRGGETIPDD